MDGEKCIFRAGWRRNALGAFLRGAQQMLCSIRAALAFYTVYTKLKYHPVLQSRIFTLLSVPVLKMQSSKKDVVHDNWCYTSDKSASPSEGTKVKNPLLILIGNNIREVRRSKKLSQQEVGHKASLDRTYMSGVENGRRNISVLAIFQIALALDVPVENLLNGLSPSPWKEQSGMEKELRKDFMFNSKHRV